MTEVTTKWVKEPNDRIPTVKIFLSSGPFTPQIGASGGYPRFYMFLTHEQGWNEEKVVDWCAKYFPEAEREQLSTDLLAQLYNRRAEYRIFGDEVLR